jgi:hypothetical protein
MSNSPDLPPELLDAARALEQHRPQLNEPQLARVRRRATGQTPTLNTRPGGFMRTRLAITAMLATGVLMSGGGAALGVSALSTDLTASSAQYGTATQNANAGAGGQNANAADNNGVLGASDEGTSGNAGANGNGNGNGEQATAAAQAPRQISASQAKRLPFTGYAAIPLLLIGLALLIAGLVLRRGTRSAPLGS